MTLEELLLSPATEIGIKIILKSPPQSLLISGTAGSGKDAVSIALAAELLGTSPEKIPEHPYFFVVKNPEGKTDIPIDAVREIIAKMNLRVPGENKQNTINRVVIISRANNLTREAQNALLKLLEEPPANTLLILTSDSENGLLPTVLSRVQRLRIVSPGLEQTIEYFESSYQAQAIKSAYMLSRGSAGLLSALLSEQANHPLKQAVDKAKLFLASKPLERMIQLQQIAKNKEDFKEFLNGLLRTTAALHQAGAAKGRDSKELLRLRKSIGAAMDGIDQNANTRLITLALAIGL